MALSSICNSLIINTHFPPGAGSFSKISGFQVEEDRFEKPTLQRKRPPGQAGRGFSKNQGSEVLAFILEKDYICESDGNDGTSH